MTNILIYVGNRNNNSRTMKLTKSILKQVADRNESLTYSFHTPIDTPLFHSTGCKTCFLEGYCPSETDKNDYGKTIKTNLLKSDIILIASPVYSHNVSSDVKVLIDRLSYWGHIFKLIGKKIVILVTAESNGDHLVIDYLTKVFRVMGAEVYHTVSFVNSEKDIEDELLEETIEVIDDLVRNPRPFIIHSHQETNFSTIKPLIQNYNSSNFEYNYWKEKYLFEYDTLKEWYENEVFKND